MSDPFTVAVSVAGLLSLGIQVTQSLVDFYASSRDRDSNLNNTIQDLESLLDILHHLSKALASRKFEVGERGLIAKIESTIKNCEEVIEELQDECQKFKKASSHGKIDTIKNAARKFTYPFRRGTLQNISDNVSELRKNVSQALAVLQLKDSIRAQNDIDDIKALVTLIKARQISRDIQDWLKAPDASINHNEACAKKHPGTGMWLVKSDAYSRWLTGRNSFLWLQGFAGCGKSVLCSTAIQSVFRHRSSDPRIGIAFFYFTFNDQSKQDESAMLRTWLLQLSSQHPNGHKDLTRLHESYRAGTPPSPVLQDYLRRLIERFDQVYLLVDALDEGPRKKLRKKVLETLEMVRSWGVAGLHLFVTSRDEPDIRKAFSSSSVVDIAMRNGGIDDDIANYISSQLTEDRSLQNWLPHRQKIQETLTKGARGVFRWVECQFESLQSCPHSEHHLDLMLTSLPESLDETYERMLCKIDKCSIEDARRILTLLCFAKRPMKVYELIDAIAVDITNGAGLNQKRRLQDVNDIHLICPGLIEIGLSTTSFGEASYKDCESAIRIAHFSVQEYLESERIRDQKAAIFSLSSGTAHAEISQICLLYLLEPALSNTLSIESLLEAFPLGHFAAEFWYHHYQAAERPGTVNGIILQLFQRQDSFATWVRLHDFDDDRYHLGYTQFSTGSPVYYASLLGLTQVLYGLICAEQHENKAAFTKILPRRKSISKTISSRSSFFGNTPQSELMSGSESGMQQLLENKVNGDSQDGRHDTAQHAMIPESLDSATELLLDISTNVNSQGGQFGTALQAASFKGHESVVRLLLNKGADVNAEGGYFSTALSAASSRGHRSVVQLLLDRGADVNARDGLFGDALRAASYRGHQSVVQLLLDRGADVNAQGGTYSNALQVASFGGHESVLQLLLDSGADVNIQGGHYGNALQEASFWGFESVVQLLLDKGADVNAQGGEYGNALQAASFEGHDSIINLLLDKGADVNAQGGECGNALQAALANDYESTVQLLIDKGADVNAQGGQYGNALLRASLECSESTVHILLDKGAVANAQVGDYGNALQAASLRGRESVVQLLLDNRADVNAQGGEYGTALQAASGWGFVSVVKLLLDKGADVNAKGGRDGNALQTASSMGHESVVQLLLDNGADVKAESGEYGNALQAASYWGWASLVKLLLDRGADVNAQGGEYGNALQAASFRGCESVVSLLLGRGVDVNAQGGKYGSALQAALSRGHASVAQLLLEKGAIRIAESQQLT